MVVGGQRSRTASTHPLYRSGSRSPLTSTGSQRTVPGVPGVVPKAKAKEAKEAKEVVETAGSSGEAQKEATQGCNRCTLHLEPIVKAKPSGTRLAWSRSKRG